ncbi:MAG TPA: alpha/beta hydrolase, partial [Candidatus Binatia bacterium]|nr:alpha/beta hydrolase [Candidatus Binatia bacterium]
MPKPRQSREFLSVLGLRTFYIKVGEGHPLVLCHGGSPGTCSSVNWQCNLDALAEAGFAVYAFDQPGFGLTDNPTDYSLEFRFAHARAFADLMKLERYHVMGNSMGAYLAARLALEDPRAKRLVLVSSNTLAPKGSPESQAKSKKHADELRAYTPSYENMLKMTKGTLYKQQLVTEELVRERYEMSTGKNYQAQSERANAPKSKSLDNELGNLKSKTLILWGRNDHGTSLDQALLLFQKIPQAELHVFDQCAHWVQWDHA